MEESKREYVSIDDRREHAWLDEGGSGTEYIPEEKEKQLEKLQAPNFEPFGLKIKMKSFCFMMDRL